MKFNFYTHQSPKVSELGLGAWQLGHNSGWKNITEQEAIRIVHHALERGVNFFDTAPNYGHGSGECRLGKALKSVERTKIVINTKFGHTHIGEQNYSARYIRESLEGSLQRLETDYVDSLIIHNPPFEILDGTKNDHYEILEQLKREGKIRAYGASLDSYDEIKQLMDTTGSEVAEVFFNILFQDIGRAFDEAKQKKMGIIVKIPLDSGWLTGKYDQDSIFEDVRSRWSRKDIQTRARLVERVKHIIGDETGLAQAAIAFCLAYDAVSTVIPGNLNTEQLDGNLESVNRPLAADMVERLEDFFASEVRDLNLPW